MCEIGHREALAEYAAAREEPKSAWSFAGRIADATNHRDSTVQALAASLSTEFIAKERSLNDAVDNLLSFKSDRVWTQLLTALLDKVIEPGAARSEQNPDTAKQQLLTDFARAGNDSLQGEEARKALRTCELFLQYSCDTAEGSEP